MSGSILSFGSINKDLVFSVPHIAAPGETLQSSAMEIGPGGKGANQACAAARTGVPVSFAGRIGADGEPVLDALSRQGVDVSLVQRGDGATGQALIQVTDSGENAIVLYRGENHGLHETYIDEVLDSFGPGDILLLQHEVNLLPYLIRGGKRRGMHIIFNPAPCTREVASYPLDLVDTLSVNELEASELVGIEGSKASDLIARVKHKSGSAEVILTMGSRGALYVGSDEIVTIPARKVRAVDATSAGDTFIGFFAGAVLKGMERFEALDIASRAAALCVTRPGALSSIPRWEEVLRSPLR